MSFTSPQRRLIESQDYGSQFMNARDAVEFFEKRLNGLKEKLAAVSEPADLRDLGSDKDRGGGAQHLRRAIKKTESQLIKAQRNLNNIQKSWQAVQPDIHESSQPPRKIRALGHEGQNIYTNGRLYIWDDKAAIHRQLELSEIKTLGADGFKKLLKTAIRPDLESIGTLGDMVDRGDVHTVDMTDPNLN